MENIEGATNFYDEDFDAELFRSTPLVHLYSIVDDKKLVIQGRALPFGEADSILLGYTSTIEASMDLSIDHVVGLQVRELFLSKIKN